MQHYYLPDSLPFLNPRFQTNCKTGKKPAAKMFTESFFIITNHVSQSLRLATKGEHYGVTCNGEIRRKRNLLVRVTHHGTSRKRAVLRDDQNYGVHENTLI